MLLILLAVASAASFLYYGSQTLWAFPPRGEYERYGMPRVRVFVGFTQLLGALGVLLGLGYHPLGAAAASGLTVMMLMGLVVRYQIRDAPRLMLPAASLAAVNAALVVLFLIP